MRVAWARSVALNLVRGGQIPDAVGRSGIGVGGVEDDPEALGMSL